MGKSTLLTQAPRKGRENAINMVRIGVYCWSLFYGKDWSLLLCMCTHAELIYTNLCQNSITCCPCEWTGYYVCQTLYSINHFFSFTCRSLAYLMDVKFFWLGILLLLEHPKKTFHTSSNYVEEKFSTESHAAVKRILQPPFLVMQQAEGLVHSLCMTLTQNNLLQPELAHCQVVVVVVVQQQYQPLGFQTAFHILNFQRQISKAQCSGLQLVMHQLALVVEMFLLL